jgi:hypothetical protein
MKRCPTCSRTFTDPDLSFCIEDGTPLVTADADRDPEATVISPSASQTSPQPANANWQTPAYTPPHLPPPPSQQRKKIWPWVVGSLGLLLLVFIGLGIAAALIVPNMMREAEQRNLNRQILRASPTPLVENSNTNDNLNTNTTANANGNRNGNGNSNSNDLNTNNSNSEDADKEAPTDQQVVLENLKNLEDEWTAANINADKKKLDRILADDYVSSVGGTMQGKADYLRDIKPDPSIQRWQFSNLKLSLNGSRSTLTGIVKLESSQEQENVEMRFTDKFVWRDGRWQAISSEVARVDADKN